MPAHPPEAPRIGPAAAGPIVGLIGFGAFGHLMARELHPHATLLAWDPSPSREAAERHGVRLATLAEVARSPVVVLATPVSRLSEAVAAVAPHLRPGALVLDVCSVKVGPAAIMERGLPAHVDIVATHPLFGPESGRAGVAGLRIAVCPIRGRGAFRLAVVGVRRRHSRGQGVHLHQGTGDEVGEALDRRRLAVVGVRRRQDDPQAQAAAEKGGEAEGAAAADGTDGDA